MKKEKTTHLCHNCLDSCTESELFIISVPEGSGPAHNVGNCEPCCKKKGLNTKNLELMSQYNKRILKQQGILNK